MIRQVTERQVECLFVVKSLLLLHYMCLKAAHTYRQFSGGSRGGSQGAMEPPFHSRLSAATVATPTKNEASIHATRLDICSLDLYFKYS